MKRKILAISLLPAFGLLTLSGCNTVEGLGRDTAKLGHKIENKGEQKDSAILKGLGRDMAKVGESMEHKAEANK